MNLIILRSRRRSVVIDVDRELNVTVKAPFGVSREKLEEFTERNSAWIEKRIARQAAVNAFKAGYSASPAGRLNRKKAEETLKARTAHWSALTGLYPRSVKLSMAEKRFGACNSRGDITLSFMLLMFEERLYDACILHELVHLKHMDHSKTFYAELEAIMPDYRQRAAELKGRIMD